MKKITQLIQTFSPTEISSLRKYYAINSRQDTILRNKLFEITLKNSPKSDKEAANFMDTKPGAAFSMLKKRLYNDALKYCSGVKAQNDLNLNFTKVDIKLG
ncbi:MAG: hypothetical protein IPI31_09560 [Bacteroidetes bacterium]|nr:hypothetical protein [Bacteroidota bacterium]